jgi:hypothetical protein
MKARKYAVTLTGTSPLLMHRDNIDAGAIVKAWTKDPANKKASVAGDDRTPAWTWLGYCYHDAAQLVIDADCLMSMLRDGGKKCSAPTGKGSMKAATQSGIMINELGWPLLANGKPVSWPKLSAMQEEEDFEAHCRAAEKMGFSLFCKRARVGTAKHVRVRPRFDVWSASGTLTVLDDQITADVLGMILRHAGFYVGLCDWRPGSPQAPGQFGRFEVSIEEVKS